jgi:hypothetical protein
VRQDVKYIVTKQREDGSTYSFIDDKRAITLQVKNVFEMEKEQHQDEIISIVKYEGSEENIKLGVPIKE